VLVCIVVGCAVLGACAPPSPSTRTVDWLLGTSSSSAPAKPTASAPLVYYAGVDGLKVYSRPHTRASILAQLSLYQKVSCYKIKKAYAYVTVEETGLRGWVNKAQLILRLPPNPYSGESPGTPGGGG